MWAMIVAAILTQAEARPLTPADAISQAHADLTRLPPDIRPHMRYLSLYSLPLLERPKAIQAIAGHCNVLSREIDLTPPAIVPGTQGSLLRVNLLDYGWDAATWEKLADPYFTAIIEKVNVEWIIWPGGEQNGTYYPPRSFQYPKRTKVKTLALAPWLTETEDARKRLTEVVAMTQSQIPVVKADWFLAQTIAQEGRAVGYYDFLRLKNQKDYDALVRFDAKLAAKMEHRRAIVLSGIAQEPRRVERSVTVLGGRWQTFDNEKATGERNPLRILDDAFKFDATEIISPLPNGMPAFWLGNDKGVRQDKAPDNVIGGDKLGQTNDTRLHICLSCIRCHFGYAKEECGVKEADFAKITKLKSVDYAKFVELRRQYLRELTPTISRDRAAYREAIKAATGGMEPFDWAAEVQRVFARYDTKVTPERAAADLGVTREAMIKAWRAYDERADLDPVLSVLMDGRSIGVNQWEEAISAAHLALRGYQQP